jgi:hypothetical protein
MPRGDKTGPNGLGKMTGRGAGYCAGNETAGFENINYGRRGEGMHRGNAYRNGMGRGNGGRGAGYGNGRGMGFRYGANAISEVNNNDLEGRISKLEEEIHSLISELKKQNQKE